MDIRIMRILNTLREAYDYFRYSFEFNAAEISKNKKTIIEGEQKILDFIGFLSSLVGPSRTAKNRIGYVINAIKKKTAETPTKQKKITAKLHFSDFLYTFVKNFN